MKSRDRVMAALDHRGTDRVPVDLGGHRSSAISAIAYPPPAGLPRPGSQTGKGVRHPAAAGRAGRGRARPFRRGHDRAGPRLCPGRRGTGRTAAPDGTACQVPVWVAPERTERGWVIRSTTGRVIAQMPDGALYFESTYFPFAEGDADHGRLEEVMSECMWNIAAPRPPG